MTNNWEHVILASRMKIIGRSKLVSFSKKHQDARKRISSWVVEVESACWKKPLDVKSKYPKASLLSKNRVVFDMGGNYRLAARVAYRNGIVEVLKIGTHDDYLRWKF